MNSPYMGKFRVSQLFSAAHDGLDLVGIDSKEIHSTVNGTVERAGWQNPNDPKEGFGLYVRIKKSGTNLRYYFGHMSEIRVSVGQEVKNTDVIGIEGSTGNSTGSHCHYCIRENADKAKVQDVCAISGITNAIGEYDDGYRPSAPAPAPVAPAPIPAPEPVSFEKNDTVYVKDSATNYTTGQKIPDWVKGRADTILQIRGDRALLKGIYSWVYLSDLTK